MKPGFAALVAILVTAVVPMTMAKTTIMSRSGPWAAFGGTDNDGNEVCGMSTHWDDGRYFGVKRYEGDKYLTVQVQNPSWRFNGGDVHVEFQMDNNGSWSADGGTERSGNTIEFTVPILRLRDFMTEFEGSERMAVQLGSNVHWSMDLTGTEDVAKSFGQCLDEMDK